MKVSAASYSWQINDTLEAYFPSSTLKYQCIFIQSIFIFKYERLTELLMNLLKGQNTGPVEAPHYGEGN